MRLDYSDKMGAVRDGGERKPKPVQKNRPRKEAVGIFGVLLVLLLLIVTFGAGAVTGWFLKGKKDAAVATLAAAKGKQQEAPVPVPAQPGALPQDTPLTFYKTLPSGGQAVIGSGLNPKIAPPAPTHAAQPAAVQPGQAPPAPVAAPAAADAPAAKPAEAKPASEVLYLVQIASYRDKKEAEAAQAKLATKGVAAYLVESKVKDKGVWYRLRVGRHLSREEAEQLSGKVGSGAAVLPE